MIVIIIHLIVMILWAFKLISNNTWYYCWQDYLHIYHCFLCEISISARHCHQHLKQKKDKMQCSMSAAVLTLHFYMAVVEWCLAFHSANVCFFLLSCFLSAVPISHKRINISSMCMQKDVFILFEEYMLLFPSIRKCKSQQPRNSNLF